MTGSVVASSIQIYYDIWAINNNTVPVNVRWERIDNPPTPSNWDLSVCTGQICYIQSVVLQYFTIQPNDSAHYKLTIDANGTIGSEDPIIYSMLFKIALLVVEVYLYHIPQHLRFLLCWLNVFDLSNLNTCKYENYN
jgi:hypothetical protein